jgi:hypothetical protein
MSREIMKKYCKNKNSFAIYVCVRNDFSTANFYIRNSCYNRNEELTTGNHFCDEITKTTKSALNDVIS